MAAINTLSIEECLLVSTTLNRRTRRHHKRHLIKSIDIDNKQNRIVHIYDLKDNID